MAYNFIEPSFFGPHLTQVKFFTKRTFDPASSSTPNQIAPNLKKYTDFSSFESSVTDCIKEYINHLVDIKKIKNKIAQAQANPQAFKARLASVKTLGAFIDEKVAEEENAIQTRLYDAHIEELNKKLAACTDICKNPEEILYIKFNTISKNLSSLEMLKMTDTSDLLSDFRFRILKAFDEHRIKVNKELKEMKEKEEKKAKDNKDVESLLKKLHDDPKKAEATLGTLIDQRVDAKIKSLNLANNKDKGKSNEPKNEQKPARGRQNNNRARGSRGQLNNRNNRGAKAGGQGKKEDKGKEKKEKDKEKPKRGGPQRGRGRGGRGNH